MKGQYAGIPPINLISVELPTNWLLFIFVRRFPLSKYEPDISVLFPKLENIQATYQAHSKEQNPLD
jgi:hypothetical protein